jgi:hypothetical protein
VNAQNELAFRKRRVRNDGGDPERDSLVAGGHPAFATSIGYAFFLELVAHSLNVCF